MQNSVKTVRFAEQNVIAKKGKPIEEMSEIVQEKAKLKVDEVKLQNDLKSINKRIKELDVGASELINLLMDLVRQRSHCKDDKSEVLATAEECRVFERDRVFAWLDDIREIGYVPSKWQKKRTPTQDNDGLSLDEDFLALEKAVLDALTDDLKKTNVPRKQEELAEEVSRRFRHYDSSIERIGYGTDLWLRSWLQKATRRNQTLDVHEIDQLVRKTEPILSAAHNWKTELSARRKALEQEELSAILLKARSLDEKMRKKKDEEAENVEKKRNRRNLIMERKASMLSSLDTRREASRLSCLDKESGVSSHRSLPLKRVRSA